MGYTQEDYWGALADPAKLRQYMADWANGGAATHGVAGAGNKGQSSYEQVLADLASRGFDINGLAQHVTAGSGGMGPGLSPSYENTYQEGLRNLQTTRDTDLATNEYARGLAQQRGDRALGDLDTQWGARRNQLPGSFIQRGVFGQGGSTSGIYQDALSRFNTQWASDKTNLQDQFNEQRRGFDVKTGDINTAYNNGQLTLKTRRAADEQTLASQLQGARPFTA